MPPLSALYFDGRFITPSEGEARIGLADPGYMLGEGVFATLRGYDGVCFRPQRHFEALARGAAAFGIPLPISLDELEAVVNEAAARTHVKDAYVRVTLTHGSLLSVISRPMLLPTEQDYSQGIDATIVTPRRIPPACMDSSVKTTSYAPQVLAKREAASRNAAEGIMLAIDGSLASGTMSNLFVVTGDRLYTPSVESGCRTGVTREAILDLARSVGLTACEHRLDAAVLNAADEAFFTSTRIECLPIARIDGRTIGVSARRFQRTTALRRALQALAHDENASLARKRRRLDPTSGSRVSQANDVHEQPRSRAIKSA